MFLKTSEKNNLINEGSKSFLAYCWINKNINNYIESKSDNSPLDSLQKKIFQSSGYLSFPKKYKK